MTANASLPELKLVPMADLFDLPIPQEVQIAVRQPGAHCLRPDPDYVFRKDLLKMVVNFFMTDNGGDGLYLYGPQGAGKSSLVQNFCARINYPIISVDNNEQTDVQDYIGRRGISFGDTNFEHGPLAVAMRNGYALLVNEVDRTRAGNITLLHGIHDGQPLHIKETGETIEAHPDFRLIYTGNSAGSGDTTGTFTGSVRRLDPAFMDRQVCLEIGYMPILEEVEMFHRMFSEFSADVIERLVSFATETRAKATDLSEPLALPLSTRALKRFFRLGRTFKLHEIALKDLTVDSVLLALGPAYMARLSPVDREATTELLRMSLGARS